MILPDKPAEAKTETGSEKEWRPECGRILIRFRPDPKATVLHFMTHPPATEQIYDSALRKIPSLEELREVFRYHYLILQLTRRDVLTRYKRSVLGIGWTMLNPLGMMIVLTIAFSQIFRFNTEYSYAAYVLSGLIAWNFFSQTTTASMVNLVWGGGLLHRIYIPRTSFALAAIATGMVNLTLSIVPLDPGDAHHRDANSLDNPFFTGSHAPAGMFRLGSRPDHFNPCGFLSGYR